MICSLSTRPTCEPTSKICQKFATGCGPNKNIDKDGHYSVKVEPPKTQTPTEESVQDLLSIVTVFSGRLYGSRAKKVRSCVSHALKECLKAEAEETDGTDCENDQTPA